MARPVPSTLSPSKLSSFTGCALQFRFSVIDGLPEPPRLATSRGTLVHAALERLYELPAPQRMPGAVPACVAAALAEYRDDPEWAGLGLSAEDEAAAVADAERLARNLFRLEDPTTVTTIGLELQLEAEVGGIRLRGIIDRLDLVDGDLVVTDYKTGRAPSDKAARARMAGVHFYSRLCEEHFGRRPARIQLLHLAEPVTIVTEPSEQSTRGLERRLGAVWRAVQSACENDDFRPRPSFRCDWCAYRQWCPSFGGDPARAAVDITAADRAASGQQQLIEA